MPVNNYLNSQTFSLITTDKQQTLSVTDSEAPNAANPNIAHGRKASYKMFLFHSGCVLQLRYQALSCQCFKKKLVLLLHVQLHVYEF